jgi:hypothetical protein
VCVVVRIGCTRWPDLVAICCDDKFHLKLSRKFSLAKQGRGIAEIDYQSVARASWIRPLKMRNC